jgi:hypothetical protein
MNECSAHLLMLGTKERRYKPFNTLPFKITASESEQGFRVKANTSNAQSIGSEVQAKINLFFQMAIKQFPLA